MLAALAEGILVKGVEYNDTLKLLKVYIGIQVHRKKAPESVDGRMRHILEQTLRERRTSLYPVHRQCVIV